MIEVVIIDAVRTPIGALGGELAAVRPDDLAALVLRALIQRSGLDPALVEEVYLGCSNQSGEDNRNVARMSALLAGFPVEVAGPGSARHPRRRRGNLHCRRGGEHVPRPIFHS
jgi:acetyl-CoA acetyltransferase